MAVTLDITFPLVKRDLPTEDQSYAYGCAVAVIFAARKADRSGNSNAGQDRAPKPPPRNIPGRAALAEDDREPAAACETAKRGLDVSKSELIPILFHTAAA